jgi:preprotein translocase SecE subunit
LLPIGELRKVSWPTLPQTRNLTVLVFTVSIAIGVFIAVVDTIFKGVIGFVAAGLGQ